jgi:2-enoate reductase
MLNLFKPGKIGKLQVKNRIVMAPMGPGGLIELREG